MYREACIYKKDSYRQYRVNEKCMVRPPELHEQHDRRELTSV